MPCCILKKTSTTTAQPACQSLDEQLNSYLTDIENLLEIGTALNYTNKVYQVGWPPFKKPFFLKTGNR